MILPPIPLSAPNGRVYAFACPRCMHVAKSGDYTIRATDAMIDGMAESSLRNADSCCRCSRCGAELPTRSWGPCDACKPIEEQEQRERDARVEARHAEEEAARERSLESALNRDAAMRLAQVMSDISEECYCAGWLTDLELWLWHIMHSDSRRFGQGAVSDEEIAELRRLHEKCGGWWQWDSDVGGEMFVPTAEWLKIYEASK